MRKKEASFWSDIKTLDERLAKDPDSYCFARLSEIYLKVGLVTDALHTARSGVAKHPGYLAGQRALAMACHASGLHSECCGALEQVTQAIPEDVDALKILAHLYAEKGDDEAAIRTYRTLLEFKPEDIGSKEQLDALLEGGDRVVRSYVDDDLDTTDFPIHAGPDAQSGEVPDDEEIYELDEADIICDEPVAGTSPFDERPKTPERQDPLSTVTLAELYEQQGFTIKALDIYRAILADDPGNENIRARIERLESKDSPPPVEPEQDMTPVCEESEYEPDQPGAPVFEEEPDMFGVQATDAAQEAVQGFVPEAVHNLVPEAVQEMAPEVVQEMVPDFDAMPEAAPLASFEPLPDFEPEAASEILPEPASKPVTGAVSAAGKPEQSVPVVAGIAPAKAESAPFAPLQNQTADNALNTLEGWLENIRRIKACR